MELVEVVILNVSEDDFCQEQLDDMDMGPILNKKKRIGAWNGDISPMVLKCLICGTRPNNNCM